TMAAVTAYRQALSAFAQLSTLDVWYAHLDEDQLMGSLRATVAAAEHDGKKAAKGAKGAKGKAGKGARSEDDRELQRAAKTAERTVRKAHSRDSLQALSKLAEQVDGRFRIVNQPPIMVPLREVTATYGFSGDETDEIIRDQFRAYR